MHCTAIHHELRLYSVQQDLISGRAYHVVVRVERRHYDVNDDKDKQVS